MKSLLLLLFGCSIVSDCDCKDCRLPCPSLSPAVCSNSYTMSCWCHPTISSCHPFLLLPSIFPGIRIFPNGLALHIRWPKYWSFSFSISPSNEYSGWFPLGLTGLISLQPKGLSRVFSSTTIQKHQFFDAQPFLRSNSHICTHDSWKNHSFDLMDLCWQNDVSAF